MGNGDGALGADEWAAWVDGIKDQACAPHEIHDVYDELSTIVADLRRASLLATTSPLAQLAALSRRAVDAGRRDSGRVALAAVSDSSDDDSVGAHEEEHAIRSDGGRPSIALPLSLPGEAAASAVEYSLSKFSLVFKRWSEARRVTVDAATGDVLVDGRLSVARADGNAVERLAGVFTIGNSARFRVAALGVDTDAERAEANALLSDAFAAALAAAGWVAVAGSANDGAFVFPGEESDECERSPARGETPSSSPVHHQRSTAHGTPKVAPRPELHARTFENISDKKIFVREKPSLKAAKTGRTIETGESAWVLPNLIRTPARPRPLEWLQLVGGSYGVGYALASHPRSGAALLVDMTPAKEEELLPGAEWTGPVSADATSAPRRVLRTQSEVWSVRCAAIFARVAPELPGVKSGAKFEKGDRVEVCDRLVKRVGVRGRLSVTFLKLSDGSGWLFDRTAKKPRTKLLVKLKVAGTAVTPSPSTGRRGGSASPAHVTPVAAATSVTTLNSASAASPTTRGPLTPLTPDARDAYTPIAPSPLTPRSATTSTEALEKARRLEVEIETLRTAHAEQMAEHFLELADHRDAADAERAAEIAALRHKHETELAEGKRRSDLERATEIETLRVRHAAELEQSRSSSHGTEQRSRADSSDGAAVGAAATPRAERASGLSGLGMSDALAIFHDALNAKGELAPAGFADALERVALRAGLARRGEREESADAIAHRLFSVFDVDGSGTVDHTELAAGLTTLCRNASRGGAGGVSEAFALYDIDGDGVVSREEMASFLRSVFTTAFRSDPNKHAAMGLISARDLAAITTASAFRLAKIDSASSMDLSAFARWWTHQNGVEGDRGHLVRPAAEHFQSKLRAPIATAQVARSPACAPSKPRPKPPQGRPRSRRPVNTPLAQRQPKGVRSGRGRARQRARGRGARTPRGRGRTIG